jgi:peptidoglycan/LPS O-acetylase OafA/YrhL
MRVLEKNQNAQFSQQTESSRMWLVDFVRQLSIGLVLSVHLFESRLAPVKDLKYWWLFLSGELGVWMFFVVSGFVISNAATKRYGTLLDIPARKFYIFRAARLLPLFGCAVIIGVIATKVPELRTSPIYRDVFDSGGRNFIFWLALFTGTFNWLRVAYDRWFGMHWDIYWSLAIEEQFYAVFPLVLKVPFIRKHWKAFLLSLFIIAPCGRYLFQTTRHGMFSGMNSFCALDLLCTGILLSLVLQKYSGALQKRLVLCHLLFGLGLCDIAYMLTTNRNDLFAVFGPSILSIGLFSFFVGGLNIRWLQELPGWLVLGGKLSYGAYLLHPVILFAIAPFISGKNFLLAYTIFFGSTMLVAWLSFNLYEQPMNRAVKRWFGKFAG